MADRCPVGPAETVVQQDRHVHFTRARTVEWSGRPSTSAGILILYGQERLMTITSQIYVGIDVSKDRLDGAVLGKKQPWQVDNAPAGIQELVEQMTDLQPELIVVEATGGYQRAEVEALFHVSSFPTVFLM